MIEDDTQGGLPRGWQRAVTLNSIPYYINHDTETTQWDHPEMTQLMTDLSGANDIRYAAYRTAIKLRAIEKKTQLQSVDLTAVRAGFNDLGYSENFCEDEIDVSSLVGILNEIFSYQRPKSDHINVADGVELTLNWLLNVYDQARRGSIRVLSAKIALGCLSVANVQEKYKYIFDQLSSSKGFIDRKRLRIFLREALQILKYIREYHSFGKAGVEPAVQSCFERAYIPERICLQEFLDWMIAEPQTIVWLPTLHRLALSETVKHEGKCNICKMFPIVGFRYRCLKCFNFDMCQSCFWSGRVAKNHKLTHRTQEYCLPATQKEDIKDFAKVVKNKVRKKNKKNKKKDPSKGRFLRINNDGTAQASDEENSLDHIDYGDTESTKSSDSQLSSNRLRETDKTASKEELRPVSSKIQRPRPVMDDEHQLISYYTSCLNGNPQPSTSTPIQTLAKLNHDQVRELDEIVQNLEDDNRYLRERILEMQDAEIQRSLIQINEIERVDEYNERLEARQEVLEDHNQRLADQLTKLRLLIQQGKHRPRATVTTTQRQNFLLREDDITNHPYHIFDRVLAHSREDLVNRSPFSPFDPYNYGRFRPLPTSAITKDFPDYQSRHNIESTPKTTKSTGYPAGYTSEEYFKDPGASDETPGTINSTTSDDDLRAIEKGMQRLLEPEMVEGGKELMGVSDQKERKEVQDSDPSFSDDQQSYLLTAASMVGEAVEDFVSSLSWNKSYSKHVELEFTDDEEEV